LGSSFDNKGNAELWIAPRIDYQSLSKKYYITDDKGKTLSAKANLFKKGENIITIDAPCLQKNLDLAFVVDATGSMGMRFLIYRQNYWMY
jgi:hypothetical protein